MPKHLLSSSFFKNPCLFQGACIPCVFNVFTLSSLNATLKQFFGVWEAQQALLLWQVGVLWLPHSTSWDDSPPSQEDTESGTCRAWHRALVPQALAPRCPVNLCCAHGPVSIQESSWHFSACWSEFKCSGTPSLPLWILVMLRILRVRLQPKWTY